MGARRDDITDTQRTQIAKVQYCLEQILRHRAALGQAGERLRELALRAAQVNGEWAPAIGEGLAGDGETWACVLWETPGAEQFARNPL